MKIIKTVVVFFLLIQGTLFAQTLQDAKKAIESEFYFKAKRILLQLNNTSPTVESNYYLGNVYLLTDKIDSAKYYYSKAAAIDDSKNALKYVAAGKSNLLNNKTLEATESFNLALKVSKSKNAEVMYQIGDAYYKINNAEAIKYYELAYSTDPNLIINLLAYGDAYLDMDKPGEAMTKYEQARAINPNIAVIHLRIGRVNAKTGKNKEAINALEKTVELDPTLGIAWKELGEVYYLDRQLTKVKVPFDKYIELNAEDKEARVVLAITCYQIGDFECAVAESKKIIASDAANFVAWRLMFYSYYNLGDTLKKLGDSLSIEKFNEGYKAVQTFWNIPVKKVQPLDYQFSARLAAEIKDTLKAVFYYDMATAVDSITTPEIYSEYAKYLYSTKKYPHAITAYSKLISDSIAGPLDYYFLGRAFVITGDYINADTIFAQFLVLQPNSLDGYLQRAKTQVRMEGDTMQGGALPFYLKYIELAEKDVTKNKKNLVDAYLYPAVYYYSVTKEETKACEFLNKAKMLDPENIYIIDLEKSIICSK